MDPNFSIYLQEEAMILVPVLWFLQFILKETPNVRDWMIPYILIVVGIVGAVAILGMEPGSFIQGTIATAVAVLGNVLAREGVKGAVEDYGKGGGQK